jgi:dienelactone hydrolase
MSTIAAPAGASAHNVHWRTLVIPNGGAVQLAVARPHGSGPFPAVILLHGTHGFADEYIDLAEEVAKGGFVAVAACWFQPGAGEGLRFVTPVSCPESAPPMPGAVSPEAFRTVDALVQAVRALPDVSPGKVAVFGQSRGGGAALNYVLQGGKADALILNSTGYPTEVTASASRVAAPVLILHGEADIPGDGGSALTAASMARAFEAALFQAGAKVESHFYPEGRHNSIFSDPDQREDEIRRIRDFLSRQFDS